MSTKTTLTRIEHKDRDLIRLLALKASVMDLRTITEADGLKYAIEKAFPEGEKNVDEYCGEIANYIKRINI